MMLSTHILMGANLGLIIGLFEPSLGATAVTAGVIGSIAPDLDMLAEHHRTLHRPFQFLAATFALLLIFLATGSGLAAFTLFVAAAATLHSFSDILSQGKTKHPEVRKDERAVYNHLKNRWIRPRRLITEGSRRDFAATLILSIPLIYYFNGASVYLSGLIVALGGVQYSLRDWFSRQYLSGYDRYSEFIQQKIGFGPETGVSLWSKILTPSRQLLLYFIVPVRDRIKS